jgi:nickel transport protein
MKARETRTARWLLSILMLVSGTTPAHDLQYTVVGGRAVVIKMFHADNSPFTFEGYEIFREGEKLPYQVGRTDSQGRIAFLPDRAATWRIKAISEDGHGLDFKVSTDASAMPSGSEKPAYERYSRIFIGIAVLLGLFGLFNLYLRRKPVK